jgi:hypothetical protein
MPIVWLMSGQSRRIALRSKHFHSTGVRPQRIWQVFAINLTLDRLGRNSQCDWHLKGAAQTRRNGAGLAAGGRNSTHGFGIGLDLRQRAAKIYRDRNVPASVDLNDA